MSTNKEKIYKEAIDILNTYVLCDCFCPCCASYEFCDYECTFRDDDMEAYEHLEYARYVRDQARFALEKLKEV